MAQIIRVEAETELKCPVDKFFEIYTNKTYLIPKICPEKVKSIQVLEGDGGSVGSVRLWNFVPGSSESAKERIVAVDEHNKTANFKADEGEILKNYKTMKSKIQVTTKNEGSLVKWTLEYEKQNEDTPPPNMYLDFLASISKDIDAYLLTV